MTERLADSTQSGILGGIGVTPVPATLARRPRIDSVDLLRGAVMVIMLLDHTRDFVHNDAFKFDPVDMSQTYPALFFTRWITHFCAPIFVFLAGTGSYFQTARGKSTGDLSRFLVTRGLWLVFLELTVVRIASGWEFDVATYAGLAQVIWALGWSMIVLAALIHLRLWAIATFGISMVALHNILDGIRVPEWHGPGSPLPGGLDKLWMVLHQGGFFPVAGQGSPPFQILYPLIPWVGVMAVGYAFGRVYDWPADRRRDWLLRVGAVVTLSFIALRFTNLYGNPGGWSPQNSPAMTVASFLNVQKYPPSLLYLMMTLGPAVLILGLWEKFNTTVQSEGPTNGQLTRAVITFGRVPLFFYLLQWVMAHVAGAALMVMTGKSAAFLNAPADGRPSPPDVGFDLWVVYAAWIVGVLLLYPLCRWYAGYKSRHRDWWLSYL